MQMFNTMSLNDPVHANRYKDTEATSYIHSNTSILSLFIDKSKILSSTVLVGDRSLIHVTNQGHTTLSLPNPYRTLALKMS